jgi:hypothetical protein
VVFIASFVLCLVITVAGIALFATSASALPSSSDGNYALFLSIGAALAIFFGILSSLVFDRLRLHRLSFWLFIHS